MNTKPDTAAAALSNPAASADAHQHALKELEELEERARVASRQLSRSWLLRSAAVAAGLITAAQARRLQAAHRASAR